LSEIKRSGKGFFAFPAGSQEAFWKFLKAHISTDASLSTRQRSTSLVPYCNDSVTRVVRNLWVPTEGSRDILQQAKGIILIESTQIRWFSRWSGGVGWSGRFEAQWRPRISKLRAKGLSDYHSNEIVVEAARWGPVGPIKRLVSRHVNSKRGADMQLLVWLKKGKKAARQRKSTSDKKERISYSNSGWWCRWEKWRWWRWWWVRTSHANHKSMWLLLGAQRTKSQKVGLNRRAIAYTVVGGG
jgi:hypothetical protein